MHRKKRLATAGVCVLTVLAVLLALASTGHAAAPLAGNLPGKPLIYVGWGGAPAHWKGYRKSRFRVFLAKSRLSEFFTRDLPEIIRHVAARNRPKARQMAENLIYSNMFYQHPFAFYVSNFQLNSRDGNLPPVGLHIELVMRAGKDAPTILAAFRNWAHQLNRHGLNPPPPALHVMTGKVGNNIYLAAGLTPQMLALLSASAAAIAPGSLQNDPAFQAVIARTRPDSALQLYANVHAMVALVNEGMARQPHVTAKIRKIEQDVEKDIHLDSYTDFAMGSGFSGRRWMQSVYLGETRSHAAPRRQAAVKSLLQMVPLQCADFSITTVDLRALTNSIFQVAAAAGHARELHQTLAMAQAFTGLDIRHGLLNTFGPNWLVYQSPYIPLAGVNGMIMVNQLRHPRRFAQTLVTLTPLMLVGANAAYRKTHPGAKPLHLLHTRVGTQTIYYLQTPTLLPAWCIADNKFYFALYPRTIQLAFEHQADKTSIANSAKFQDVLRRLGNVSGIQGVGYADDPALVPAGYMGTLLISKLVPLLTGMRLHPPLTSLLPTLGDLEDILTPSGSITWTDSTGFHSRNISAFPGGSLLTP